MTTGSKYWVAEDAFPARTANSSISISLIELEYSKERPCPFQSQLIR